MLSCTWKIFSSWGTLMLFLLVGCLKAGFGSQVQIKVYCQRWTDWINDIMLLAFIRWDCKCGNLGSKFKTQSSYKKLTIKNIFKLPWKLGNSYKIALIKQQENIQARLAHFCDSHSASLMRFQKSKLIQNHNLNISMPLKYCVMLYLQKFCLWLLKLSLLVLS